MVLPCQRNLTLTIVIPIPGNYIERTRRSACVPAAAGTHPLGRDARVEGFRRCLGEFITAVSCCGWEGKKTMPSGGKVGGTHAPD